MRTEPEGPGWWLASDGRWYPPELHPAVLSGDRTPDELRSAPLSGRSDRTTIRWVADAESTTPAEPRATLAVEPVATLQAEPGSTVVDDGPSGPDLAPADGIAEEPDIVVVDREPATIDLRAPGDEPSTGVAAPPRAETDRVRGAVATGGGPEYELPPERPSRFLLLGVAAAALALIAISAITFLTNDDDEPDGGTDGATAGTAQVTEAPVLVTVSDLEVGDCLANPELEIGNLAAMTRADCAGPHTHEVFLTTAWSPEGDRFDVTGMETFASEVCQDGFEDFIGVPYVRSRYLFLALGPTRDTWAQGERTIACVVYDPAGEVTGTLRDAGA